MEWLGEARLKFQLKLWLGLIHNPPWFDYLPEEALIIQDTSRNNHAKQIRQKVDSCIEFDQFDNF